MQHHIPRLGSRNTNIPSVRWYQAFTVDTDKRLLTSPTDTLATRPILHTGRSGQSKLQHASDKVPMTPGNACSSTTTAARWTQWNT